MMQSTSRALLFSSPWISDLDFNKEPWNEKNLDSLLLANKVWAARKAAEDPMYFEINKQGHSPKILWIGCSDARVPANDIIGQRPGTVFVHRNIANMVIGTDFNCMSVIQYAVDVLKVKHIIVCGHYDCGGIKAALTNVDHKSPLENWVRNIRDTVRLHKTELSAISDLKQRRRRLVELNVVEQCLNVFKTSVVQRRRVETFKNASTVTDFTEPRVHAFVYEPTTGEAHRIKIDLIEHIRDLREVYDVYNIDSVSPTADACELSGDEIECLAEVVSQATSGTGDASVIQSKGEADYLAKLPNQTANLPIVGSNADSESEGTVGIVKERFGFFSSSFWPFN